MGVPASTLAKLIELARETSSEKRRQLLRDVTDLFFETPADSRSRTEAEHFDIILSSVAEEMTLEVRAEMAARFAAIPDAPRRLMRQLAHDDIGVAAQILRRSLALDDDDLITVANAKGQEHLRAIAGRETLSERVSDAVADRADPETMTELVSNAGATLSRRTLERAVDQAACAEQLQLPLIHRDGVPNDLLAEMYHFVEERLKAKIRQRAVDLSDETLRIALDPARRRARPEDFADALAFARKAKLRRELNAALLAQLLRDRERTRFLVCFAEIADIDYEASVGVFDDPTNESLAMVCKAARLDRSLFVTLALLRGGDRPKEQTPEKTADIARELKALFDRTPLSSAERVMRFWRLRKKSGDGNETRAA